MTQLSTGASSVSPPEQLKHSSLSAISPAPSPNVDSLNQQHKKKEYQQMYIIGKVPVMKIGGFVLGQSGAIIIYFCQRYPNFVEAKHQQKTFIEGIFDVIGKLNELLTKNRTKFITGDRVTISDFLFFHKVTNLVYLRLEQDRFMEARRWYSEVYSVPEVKAITHEWFKKMLNMFKQVDNIRDKL